MATGTLCSSVCFGLTSFATFAWFALGVLKQRCKPSDSEVNELASDISVFEFDKEAAEAIVASEP